nr:protein TPR3-like [Ipomoea batatas]
MSSAKKTKIDQEGGLMVKKGKCGLIGNEGNMKGERWAHGKEGLKVVSKLEGHLKGISCLAFSNALNVLISSGIDAQVIVWDCNKWEKQRSTVLQISPDWSLTELSETIIQFHQDHKRFLAVHETQLSIYEACTLHCVKQWMMRNFCTRICHATFSCNNQFVYAVMRDGIVLILDASHLCPRFEIDPSTYIPSDISVVWETVVSLARLYDMIFGLIVLAPLAFLSWMPGFQSMQTRILFNEAFSRGLQISQILTAKSS